MSGLHITPLGERGCDHDWNSWGHYWVWSASEIFDSPHKVYMKNAHCKKCGSQRWALDDQQRCHPMGDDYPDMVFTNDKGDVVSRYRLVSGIRHD